MKTRAKRAKQTKEMGMVFHCTLLVGKRTDLDNDRLQAAIMNALPGKVSIETIDPTDLQHLFRHGSAEVGLRVGEDLLAISDFHEVPDPAQLREICSAAWWWPQATMSCDSTTAQVEVVFSGAASKEEGTFCQRSTGVALRFSRIVAGITPELDAIAMIWGGSTINESGAFRAMIAQSGESALPLHVWIGFLIQRHDDAQFLLATNGMTQFGLPEFETIVPTSEITRVHGQIGLIAQYSCENGPVLKDGSVIDLSDSERVLVRATNSLRKDGEQVLRLEFITASAN